MKTSNLLKFSLGLLVTSIIIVAVLEVLEKKKLKTCEGRQSFRCPRFICPSKNDTCGYKPFICPKDQDTCTGDERCVGYCNRGEKNCLD